MKCAWQSYLNLLPIWMRQLVDKYGRERLLELRLRINKPPELITLNGPIWLERLTTEEDLRFSVNVASHYSPWACQSTLRGYITAPGGHRMGLCGSAVMKDGSVVDVRDLTSICIRVSRDFEGIAKQALQYDCSVLIIGRPGCGKTTFLRDYVRQLSYKETQMVAVVDEREEIFPRNGNQFCFDTGKQIDIISGFSKRTGVEIMLRNMTPSVIALDEITAHEDCKALLYAGWCGTRLIATAHAGTKRDLYSRPVYRPLVENQLFDTLIVFHSDRSWHIEGMKNDV